MLLEHIKTYLCHRFSKVGSWIQNGPIRKKSEVRGRGLKTQIIDEHTGTFWIAWLIEFSQSRALWVLTFGVSVWWRQLHVLWLWLTACCSDPEQRLTYQSGPSPYSALSFSLAPFCFFTLLQISQAWSCYYTIMTGIISRGLSHEEESDS